MMMRTATYLIALLLAAPLALADEPTKLREKAKKELITKDVDQSVLRKIFDMISHEDKDKTISFKQWNEFYGKTDQTTDLFMRLVLWSRKEEKGKVLVEEAKGDVSTKRAQEAALQNLPMDGFYKEDAKTAHENWINNPDNKLQETGNEIVDDGLKDFKETMDFKSTQTPNLLEWHYFFSLREMGLSRNLPMKFFINKLPEDLMAHKEIISPWIPENVYTGAVSSFFKSMRQSAPKSTDDEDKEQNFVDLSTYQAFMEVLGIQEGQIGDFSDLFSQHAIGGDTEGNLPNKLTYINFQAMWKGKANTLHSLLKGSSASAPFYYFIKMDGDGSGAIEAEEIEAYFFSCGETPTEEDDESEEEEDDEDEAEDELNYETKAQRVLMWAVHNKPGFDPRVAGINIYEFAHASFLRYYLQTVFSIKSCKEEAEEEEEGTDETTEKGVLIKLQRAFNLKSEEAFDFWKMLDDDSNGYLDVFEWGQKVTLRFYLDMLASGTNKEITRKDYVSWFRKNARGGLEVPSILDDSAEEEDHDIVWTFYSLVDTSEMEEQDPSVNVLSFLTSNPVDFWNTIYTGGFQQQLRGEQSYAPWIEAATEAIFVQTVGFSKDFQIWWNEFGHEDWIEFHELLRGWHNFMRTTVVTMFTAVDPSGTAAQCELMNVKISGADMLNFFGHRRSTTELMIQIAQLNSLKKGLKDKSINTIPEPRSYAEESNPYALELAFSEFATTKGLARQLKFITVENFFRELGKLNKDAVTKIEWYHFFEKCKPRSSHISYRDVFNKMISLSRFKKDDAVRARDEDMPESDHFVQFEDIVNHWDDIFPLYVEKNFWDIVGEESFSIENPMFGMDQFKSYFKGVDPARCERVFNKIVSNTEQLINTIDLSSFISYWNDIQLLITRLRRIQGPEYFKQLRKKNERHMKNQHDLEKEEMDKLADYIALYKQKNQQANSAANPFTGTLLAVSALLYIIGF